MLAAVGVAAACTPQPALGSVADLRSGKVHVVDLASCRDRVVRTGVHGQVEFTRSGTVRVRPVPRPFETSDGRFSLSVRASGSGRSAKQTIWVTDRRSGRSHPVFSETQYYKQIGPGDTPGPIILLGWSGDDRWIFFTIDPGGSGSIAADGLILRVVPAAGGRVHELAPMLVYSDYLTWCGGMLVFTAGHDRVAGAHNHLLVATPPQWRPRPLVGVPGRAWGSVSCAPGRRSVIVQSQPASDDPSFFATRWSLWRVGLDGSMMRLTSPPPHYADESPRVSRDGRAIMFVRSRNGVGALYALHGRTLVGPFARLGFSPGYYGHQDWWQRLAWSRAADG
jgi:hypothetical protein